MTPYLPCLYLFDVQFIYAVPTQIARDTHVLLSFTIIKLLVVVVVVVAVAVVLVVVVVDSLRNTTRFSQKGIPY